MHLSQPPGGIDRRAATAADSQYKRTLIPTVQTYQPPADSFMECPNREYLVNVIERQVLLARQQQTPLSLVLVEMLPTGGDTISYADVALNAVTKIFRSHLRPTDVIVRYRQKTLGLLLPESDQKGSERVCARLGSAISRRLFFGRESVVLSPIFGISDNMNRFGNPGDSLLTLAELQLDLAKQALKIG